MDLKICRRIFIWLSAVNAFTGGSRPPPMMTNDHRMKRRRYRNVDSIIEIGSSHVCPADFEKASSREANSLQDVGVNIHSGSCNRHTKNRNIKKDRKVESEDQERKWERTTIKKSGGCRPEGTQFVNYPRRCWWWLTQTESFAEKEDRKEKNIIDLWCIHVYV